ncbi:MAG: hypothetical protein WCD79_00405 [Chthoniobacteraceae bacterium]
MNESDVILINDHDRRSLFPPSALIPPPLIFSDSIRHYPGKSDSEKLRIAKKMRSNTAFKIKLAIFRRWIYGASNVHAFDQPTYDAPGHSWSTHRFVIVGCAAPGGSGSTPHQLIPFFPPRGFLV